MTERIDDHCDGRAALYALGALGEAERSRFEEHLEASLDCVREVKSLLPVAHHLPQTVLPIDPPPALRERVLREVAGWTPEPPEPEPATHEEPAIPPTTAPSPPAVRRKSGIGPLFWVVALLLVAVGGGGGSYVAALHRQIADLRADAQSANTRADILELEATVADLEAARRDEVIEIAIDPTVRSLTLAGQPLAPVGAGRALWTGSGAMAFLATGLPPPARGRDLPALVRHPRGRPGPRRADPPRTRRLRHRDPADPGGGDAGGDGRDHRARRRRVAAHRRRLSAVGAVARPGDLCGRLGSSLTRNFCAATTAARPTRQEPRRSAARTPAPIHSVADSPPRLSRFASNW